MVYIYALEDPITCHVRYVGKTVNIKKRITLHLYSVKVKTKKQSWIKSLKSKGLKPNYFIIDEVEDDNWQFWEKHYISLYKSFGFNLTNSTNGGDGGDYMKGRKMSDETREKIRQSKLNMSDEYRANLSRTIKGRVFSDKAKENLRIAHLHQKNENLRKPIIQFDLNMNFINEFVSVSEASRMVLGNVRLNSSITTAIKREGTCHGFKWKYKME